MNRFDCGMFMLKYADFYSRDIGLCFSQVKQCTGILTAAPNENETDEANFSKPGFEQEGECVCVCIYIAYVLTQHTLNIYVCICFFFGVGGWGREVIVLKYGFLDVKNMILDLPLLCQNAKNSSGAVYNYCFAFSHSL